MAAKVVWYREAWWVRTRWGGNKKKDRRIGTTRTHKRQAEEIAKKINAALALGSFATDAEPDKTIPFGPRLLDWHRRYSVTFKPRYQETSATILERHLVRHLLGPPLLSLRPLSKPRLETLHRQ